MASIHFSGAGAILRKRRNEKGLTIAKVAELMNISRSTLSRYETNDIPVSDDIIRKFAKALRINGTDLLHDCFLYIRSYKSNSPFQKLLCEML